MTSALVSTFGLAVLGSAALLAQAPAQPAHLQAPRDPGYAALIATCKTPPPAAAARGGGAPGARPGGPGGGAPQGAAPQGRPGGAAPAGPAEYTVTEIPGVVAAGQRWKLEWQVDGNNADGILADTDGALLLAQNDNGAIVKLVNGKVTTVYRDLNTSGALSRNSKGALFVVERGLHAAVRQIAPQNRVLANTFNGDPLDCLGGVINDLTADSKGGVYFTMGGLFYADPKGVVKQYGEGLRTNGVVLSPDEKVVYVTNGNSVAAFDVQADGSLTNQRAEAMPSCS